VLLFVSFLSGAINFMSHCNIDMRMGYLNYLFVTPETHRWHHVNDPASSGRNFWYAAQCVGRRFPHALSAEGQATGQNHLVLMNISLQESCIRSGLFRTEACGCVAQIPSQRQIR